MEFEAIDEGTIGQVLVAEGTDNVKVGTVIATIAGEGEEAASSPAPASARAEPVEAPSSSSATEQEKSGPSTSSGQTEEKAEKPAATARADDPAIPEGTAMVKLTVREALRDAMAEEMRADDRVLDRKSTRLNPVTNAHMVCRLL